MAMAAIACPLENLTSLSLCGKPHEPVPLNSSLHLALF